MYIVKSSRVSFDLNSMKLRMSENFCNKNGKRNMNAVSIIQVMNMPKMVKGTYFCDSPDQMCSIYNNIKLNSVALVRERTIPTERPPPVGEVSANFCG
jgi:hypothetical protein